MTSIEQNNYESISAAISQKKMISFTYLTQNGNKVGKKKIVNIEPFLIGQHKKTKNILLTGYFLPTSEQYLLDDFEGWKYYLLSNISEISILEIPFTANREKYNAKPEMMDKVLVSISV